MKLGVNVDHIATLRQARKGVRPDPVAAAKVCQKAGAYSLVMHLREDRRHIQDKDVFRTKKELKIKFNLEMSLAPSIIKIALKLAPDQVTLVPEKRQEMTTERGLNVLREERRIGHAIELFRRKKIITSLFIDPDSRQVKAAADLGAESVEFHTGTYAEVKSVQNAKKEFQRIYEAVKDAESRKLVCHAGHGLDYHNVQAISKIKGIEELNIGFSIVSRALFIGLDQAVRQMRHLMESAP